MAALTALSVRGQVRVPGDKSISHRALILAALASGESTISGILDSADTRSTAHVLRALGADMPKFSPAMRVRGLGSPVPGRPGAGLRQPRNPLDCGNSGTTARLMAGVVAGAGLTAKFVGDASLSRRPMRRVAEPLRAMGAQVELPPEGGLPMTVRGAQLRDADWESSVASAQIKSAILLAALVAGVRARIREPVLSRDHTERMLSAAGVEIRRKGSSIELPAGQKLQPIGFKVPADPSSAAFFVALALLADEGELRMPEVCLNPTRTGFVEAVRRMGAVIDFADQRVDGGESLGTIIARPSKLSGIEIGPEEVPAMIDELPLVACMATRAEGDTVVRGAAELRVKESDRIHLIVSNLTSLGADAEELPDGFRVRGTRNPLRGRASTSGDHRVAMAFGILGALSGNEIAIQDSDCVGVSFPSFWSELQRVRT